jgi:hypothetical protein
MVGFPPLRSFKDMSLSDYGGGFRPEPFGFDGAGVAAEAVPAKTDSAPGLFPPVPAQV